MKKAKALFRYTDRQKKELYEFVKVRLQQGVPFKLIFRLVKTDFPWYRAKSIIAFQLYWKYLKEEFLTYGTPNADAAYAGHEKAYKLDKKAKKALSKTWSGVNKVKVLVEKFDQDPVRREARVSMVLSKMTNPCSEVDPNIGSLPIDHIVGIVSDLAVQVLDQLPVIMISALKTHHKDAAKFEKIKGLIAETAGNLDRLDDLIKNLKEFREVLG